MLSAVSIDPTSVLLTWDSPVLEEQNGVIQEYLVNVTVSETGEHFQLQYPASPATISDLHPYYTYNIFVAAVTVATGPFSEVVSTRTLPTGMP